MGASIGAPIGGVGALWGGAIGGLAGGAMGYFSGAAEENSANQSAEQMRQLQEFNRQHYKSRQQNLAQIYQMYGPYMNMVNEYTGTNYKPPTPMSGGYFG